MIDEQEVTQGVEGFAGSLEDGDSFGRSVTRLGDLDNNGTLEVAIGAYLDDADGKDVGSVWILSLDANGTVQSQQQITAGSLGGALAADDEFGVSVDALGDINGDNDEDLAAGTHWFWLEHVDLDGTTHLHDPSA